jgi:Skp family chaperone for outer membrane proteins
MKTTSTFVLGAAMFASTMFAAPSQTSEAAKIAFINGDEVLETSSIGQQARQQLENSMTQWQERLTALNTDLENLNRQRQEQALTLNEAALARLNQDIEEKSVQLDRLNDDARRDLQRLEQQATLDINSQLGPLVERFAAERGYDLIIDSARLQGILYFSPAKDVSEEFLQLVNSSVVGPTQD